MRSRRAIAIILHAIAADDGARSAVTPIEMIVPQLQDACVEEDTGYFFKRLGEICFNPADQQAYPGAACAVAAGRTTGSLFLSDARGAAMRCRGI